MIISEITQIWDNIWEIVVFCSILALQSILTWVKGKKHLQQLETIKADVKDTKKELSTNGGDATMKDVLTNINSKIDKQGIAINTCIGDIGSIRSQIENLTFENRARTEFTMNQSPVAMYIANEKSDVTFTNTAMNNLFGANSPHLLNRKRFNFISTQKQKTEAIEALQLALESGTDFKMGYEILSRKTIPHKLIKVCDSSEVALSSTGKFMWMLGRIEEVVD